MPLLLKGGSTFCNIFGLVFLLPPPKPDPFEEDRCSNFAKILSEFPMLLVVGTFFAIMAESIIKMGGDKVSSFCSQY